MMMDRTGRLAGASEADADAFQESLSRLSIHLATRQQPTHELPDPLPPPRHFRIAWPYVLLIAIVGAVAVGYPCYTWLAHDEATPAATHRVAAAMPAPAPVLAVASIVPEPASPPPPRVEPAAPIDVAAEIPPPPALAPPVTLAAPADTTAPQPEIALSRNEIVEIQKRLASLGINPGAVDGVPGPRTTASVQKYETRVGHSATGKVDRNLLTLLRQDRGTASTLQARTP
jgi:hypothetical protein